ncbi:uncharacterized protein TNCV_2562511 [Trichonephila clavipes]|uniref:Uncharacterized protein n=1 Tax=Trichonephila clavipes TaxID=2585209 RepID=A0A8X6R5T6_TRICX|nr:uncharacterized protein TNCV_2562511 [Trichonephila clavipes]
MTPYTITPAVEMVCRCQFSCDRQHFKRRYRCVGVKGSTLNGRRDPKCPKSRRLRMVREDTGAPSKGAICACVHFLRCGGLLEAGLSRVSRAWSSCKWHLSVPLVPTPHNTIRAA